MAKVPPSSLPPRSNAVATVDPAPVCCDAHGPLSERKHQNSRVVHARNGLRGVRVGEASNPGPRRQCRHRFASSSEDEFLVRPIAGRDVIPRMEPRMEPDSNRFAALADAETVLAGTQELEEVGDIRERRSHVGDLETIVDALEEDLGWRDRQAKNSGPRRRRRIRGEGSDRGSPVHDLTLIDSSDDDAPFVVTRRSAASVARGPETEGEAQEDFSQAENIQPVRRLGRRLVLVPQSTGTPRSVQDRSDFTATVVDESTDGIHNDSIMESVEAVQSEGIVAEDGVANRRPHHAQARRRLVLVSQSDPQEAPLGEWDSDTDSIGGASGVEVEDVLEPLPVQPVIFEAGVRAPTRAFASLDAVDLSDVFASRPRVMRAVPAVIRGAFRAAVRVALQEIVSGEEANNNLRIVRAWKLFLLLPRMLLLKPARGRAVPKRKLEGRFKQFQDGEWLSLLTESSECAEQAQVRAVRSRRRPQDDQAQRAVRALTLVRMGELSSARQAF